MAVIVAYAVTRTDLGAHDERPIESLDTYPESHKHVLAQETVVHAPFPPHSGCRHPLTQAVI